MKFTIDGESVKLCVQEISCKTLRISVLPEKESVKEVFSTLDLADKVHCP